MKLTKLKAGLLGVTAMGICATSAMAAIEGENWWIGGRIKQGFSLAYDLENNGASKGPSNFLLEVRGNWRPTNSITIKADVWLRGDWYADIGSDIKQGGIQDFTSPGFVGQFGFNINGNGAGFPGEPFGSRPTANRFFSDFNDEMLRELSIQFKDPEGRFSLKVGKFQRGWGQSDGLRLLDVLNAQDLRERFVLRDAEDVRIPAWTAALNLNFRRMGLSKPFEAIGMKRTSLELIFMPEVRHSKFVINNPTSGATSGGIFGFPYPRLLDSKSGLGTAFFGTNLTDNAPDKFSFSDPNLAARLKFEAFGGDMTLNWLYGHQELPVTSLQGANLLLGTALNDERQATAVIPLTLDQGLGAAHAPGQYLDFLRSLVSAPGSVPFPLAPFGCTSPLVGAPNCSLNYNFNLDYDFRKKLVGGSFTREISELRLGPKNVSPVLRTEFSYEFDKPFNTSRVITPFGEEENGTTALVSAPSSSIVFRDQWSVMVGVDYFLWLPFLKNQRGSIFTSAQFFNIHTNNSDNLLYQAPYAAIDSRVNKNQQFATLLWNFALYKEKLFIEGLSVWDISFKGFTHRQRIDFNFFGDTFRPRLEWIHVSGKKEQGLLGFFKNSDIIEASLTVQF
ncbi:MAG: hypothetical protein GXP00_02765 [Alphaproteobacteria bacterium]|nr:hypothetical protein [Alphaproteobacteria bacterium]